MPVWITVATIGATWITIGIIVYGIWKYNGEFYIVEDEPFMVIFGWPIFVFIMSISILRRVANFLAGIIRPAENKPEMSPPPVPPTQEQWLAAIEYVADEVVQTRIFNNDKAEWTKRAFERWSDPDELIDNVSGMHQFGQWPFYKGLPKPLSPFRSYDLVGVGYLWIYWMGGNEDASLADWQTFRQCVKDKMEAAIRESNQAT